MPLLAKHIFITGQPGIGKTTLCCAAVRDIDAAGFYTEEQRVGGERTGFAVVAVGSPGSEAGTLATLGRGSAMVGKYAVDVASFERVALPSLDAAESSSITVIDEIGKMELFSTAFLPRVESVLDGNATVLGTLPMPRYGHTIEAVECVRQRPDVAVVKLLKASRDETAEAVHAIVRAAAARGQPGQLLDVSALADWLQDGQAEKLGGSLPPPPAPPPTPPPATVSATTASATATTAWATAASASASAKPLIGERPRVLLVGETASAAPAPSELPYAERSMWPVLRAALDLPASAPLTETQAAALGAGVAVWDVLANVHVRGSGRKRGGAADACYNDLPALLAAFPSIQRIGFIGAKAKATYDRSEYADALDGVVTLHVLPSSSRANAQPVAAKAEAWRRVLFDKA